MTGTLQCSQCELYVCCRAGKILQEQRLEAEVALASLAQRKAAANSGHPAHEVQRFAVGHGLEVNRLLALENKQSSR